MYKFTSQRLNPHESFTSPEIRNFTICGRDLRSNLEVTALTRTFLMFIFSSHVIPHYSPHGGRKGCWDTVQSIHNAIRWERKLAKTSAGQIRDLQHEVLPRSARYFHLLQHSTIGGFAQGPDLARYDWAQTRMVCERILRGRQVHQEGVFLQL